MFVECPNCKQINRIAGLRFKTDRPEGELTADGKSYRTIIRCVYCNCEFVPHPLEQTEADKKLAQSLIESKGESHGTE